MAFNTADLLTTKYGDKSLLAGKEEITLDTAEAGVNIPKHYWTKDPSKDAPLYRFKYRKAFGYHLEPVDQPDGMIGPMANGVYADVDHIVAKGLSRIAGYPVSNLIPVFDYFETQERYNANWP